MKKSILIFLVVAAITSQANAKAPDWVNDPLTVHVEWNFDLPESDVWDMDPSFLLQVGDGGIHHIDTPSTYAYALTDWFEWKDGGIRNKTNVRHSLSFSVTNWVDNHTTKDIRVQTITSGGTATVYNISGWQTVKDANSIFLGWGDQFDSGFDSQNNLNWEDWRIHPNPNREVITIDLPAGATLDKIAIDTISYTPEPSTLLLLGFGAVMLRRKD